MDAFVLAGMRRPCWLSLVTVPNRASSAATGYCRRWSSFFSATSLRGGSINGPQRPAPARPTPLVLHVTASHGRGSLVDGTADRLFQALEPWQHEVVRRDLWHDRLVNYGMSHMAAKMRLMRGKGSPEDEDLFRPVHEIAEELNAASMLVISTPMWNFSFPYVLKQYVDIAVQPGINFEGEASGAEGIQPVTSGKALVIISSSGGSYAKGDRRDHLGPYLKDIFSMVGFDENREIRIQGAMRRSKEDMLAEAFAEADQVADDLLRRLTSKQNR